MNTGEMVVIDQGSYDTQPHGNSAQNLWSMSSGGTKGFLLRYMHSEVF